MGEGRGVGEGWEWRGAGGCGGGGGGSEGEVEGRAGGGRGRGGGGGGGVGGAEQHDGSESARACGRARRARSARLTRDDARRAAVPQRDDSHRRDPLLETGRAASALNGAVGAGAILGRAGVRRSAERPRSGWVGVTLWGLPVAGSLRCRRAAAIALLAWSGRHALVGRGVPLRPLARTVSARVFAGVWCDSVSRGPPRSFAIELVGSGERCSARFVAVLSLGMVCLWWFDVRLCVCDNVVLWFLFVSMYRSLLQVMIE